MAFQSARPAGGSKRNWWVFVNCRKLTLECLEDEPTMPRPTVLRVSDIFNQRIECSSFWDSRLPVLEAALRHARWELHENLRVSSSYQFHSTFNQGAWRGK